MKTLITGGAGFIGSYLARQLMNRGEDVVVIDNFSDYYSKKSKLFNLDLITHIGEEVINYSNTEEVKLIAEKLVEYDPKLKKRNSSSFMFYEVDIRDFDELSKIFEKEKIDKIVHLAAMAGVPYSIKMPLLYTSVNINGTVNLLELAKDSPVKKFVFGSSSSVYGNNTKVPFSEDDQVDQPISPYAATKRMGEIICYTYNHLYQYDVVCARIFGPIYGPLQRPYGMAAQKFIRQVDGGLPISIYGDGSMKRDSTYIDDEVRGLINCLDSKVGYDIVNIGTGKPISVNKMAELTIKYMKSGKIKHLPKPPTEVKITYADTSKAKREYNFEAEMSYEDGIKRQIEVYKLMPDWYKQLKI